MAAEEAFRELTAAAMELLISVGIMTSVAESWPEDVQERWDERIKDQTDWARRQTEEVHEFASSYD